MHTQAPPTALGAAAAPLLVDADALAAARLADAPLAPVGANSCGAGGLGARWGLGECRALLLDRLQLGGRGPPHDC
eukprot:5346354-Prymnesium_polylepis.2